MDVIFGVPARDGTIKIQLEDDQVPALKSQLDDAFAKENGTILWVTDKDGVEYGIPTEKIMFVEFSGAKASQRRVGFSAE
jgi:hypothetical protein